MPDHAPTSSERLRDDLRDSGDPRAQRTRASILDAAHRLSTAGADVTVASLAREAAVSRSSFYTHFADVGEVALRMHEPYLAAMADRAADARAGDGRAAMLTAQRELAAYFRDHRTLYAAAFRMPGHAVEAQIEDTIRASILPHLDAIGGPPAGVDAVATARYIAAGATHLVRAWVVGELGDDVDLAQQLYALMPLWMHEPAHTPSTTTATLREESTP